jgi:hypothetical protein
MAVHKGGMLLAALGDVAGLAELLQVLDAMSETTEWASYIRERLQDATLADQVLEIVKATPGTLQAGLGKTVEGVDKERLRALCYWLERVGRLRREKQGRSYSLYV